MDRDAESASPCISTIRILHDAMGRVDAEQLRAFVAVARVGRFTRAARQLGTTQPSLSRRVAQLEAEVGAKLVVRAPRGVVLTSAGERLLPYAERALASLDAGKNSIEEVSGEPRGMVAIGATPTVGAYALPDVLAEFHSLHPAVVMRIVEALPETLEARVANGEIDMALLNLPVRRLDLAAQKLWQEDYLLAVPRGHKLASSKRPIALADAATEALVVVPGVPATAALFAACEERGVRPHVIVEAENLEAARRMVERGVGVALIPRLMAKETGPRKMVAVEVGRGGIKRQVALVHRGEAYLTAAGRAMRGVVVRMLRA
jgi:DNA-binding transcriptional LysR family regulator